MDQRVFVLDTTLRDGAQREGISFSVEDKLRIARKLDELGVAYIEGGWPGSNPKDAEFFERVQEIDFRYAKVAAFGSTRRANTPVEEDRNVQALLDTGTPVAVVVGKSSTMHVTEVLRTSLEENLAMIRDTVSYLIAQGREVLYDAEHFFDGYLLDRQYTLDTLSAAMEAGAKTMVLCDTNGGMIPSALAEIVAAVKAAFPHIQLGIHCHNDIGVAVANTLVAVDAGARHIQGTINGYGERCGNANLCSLIPTLQLKMGYQALANGDLTLITEAAHYVSEVANLRPDPHEPYVGHSAFAHKAGLHVNALMKVIDSYQHMDPALVGNQMRVLVSELSGRANVAHKLAELGIEISPEQVAALAEQIKVLESQGYQYEGAEGSFELLVRRLDPDYVAPFEVLDSLVLVEKRTEKDILAEATVKAMVGDEMMHTAADGNGPVNALDAALRKALVPHYPEIAKVKLVDFKVRIIDGKAGTGAVTRVFIDASDGETSWTTVGCSENIIEASFHALIDSLELPLLGRTS